MTTLTKEDLTELAGLVAQLLSVTPKADDAAEDGTYPPVDRTEYDTTGWGSRTMHVDTEDLEANIVGADLSGEFDTEVELDINGTRVDVEATVNVEGICHTSIDRVGMRVTVDNLIQAVADARPPEASNNAYANWVAQRVLALLHD